MRLLHGTSPLELDRDLAKELQAKLDVASVTFKEDDELPLEEEFTTNCASNVFLYEDSIAKDMQSTAQDTAAYWYKGNEYYNYATGDTTDEKPKPLKAYMNFVRMMWKASTKAAFAMVAAKETDARWVVGYYCYEPAKLGSGALRNIKNI